MESVQTLTTRFQLPNTRKTLVRIAGSSIAKDPQGAVFQLPNPGAANAQRSFTIPVQGGVQHLLLNEAATLLNDIESLYFPNYRNVADSPVWQRLYGYAQRNLLEMTRQGVVANSALPYESIPCHYCGIVLPKDLIQIDHQQPQTHKALAVGKVFHALNAQLTMAPGVTRVGAALTKNQQTAQILAAINAGNQNQQNLVAQINGVMPKAWNPFLPWNRRTPNNLSPKGQRYVLTDKGNLLLSVGIMVNGHAGFLNQCVHSLLNLAPACGTCNVHKSNMQHIKGA